ncbi:MAG: hypothetical protein IT290_08645, partial [Deltaproteobacteria bacterium]|nr:hypothetical protein [Deltaproteobacteria bacterium]
MFLITLIKALSQHKVRYAVAGGYAVSLHGAVRTTFDVDLVVSLDEKNLQRLESALNGLHLQSRLPISASDVFNFRTEYIAKRNMIAWSFVNTADPSQLVDVIIAEDLRSLRTSSVVVLGTRIPILSIDSLVAMKKKSGRPQDIEDISALERL